MLRDKLEQLVQLRVTVPTLLQRCGHSQRPTEFSAFPTTLHQIDFGFLDTIGRNPRRSPIRIKRFTERMAFGLWLIESVVAVLAHVNVLVLRCRSGRRLQRSSVIVRLLHLRTIDAASALGNPASSSAFFQRLQILSQREKLCEFYFSLFVLRPMSNRQLALLVRGFARLERRRIIAMCISSKGVPAFARLQPTFPFDKKKQ